MDDITVTREDIEGWLVASDDEYNVLVALDTTITPELELLGLARELVSRIQTLRKGSGLEITDRISLKVAGSEKLLRAVESNSDYIRQETLALSLDILPMERASEGRKEEVNGEMCSVVLGKSSG